MSNLAQRSISDHLLFEVATEVANKGQSSLVELVPPLF
jgi:hypothetical protein